MGNKKRKLDLDLSLIDKYCTSSNPVFNVIPLRLTYDFCDLDEHQKKELEEYANIEDGHVERWILVPDTVSLGTLAYIAMRAFGLPPVAFSTAFTLDEDEQRLLFPTMNDALEACGSVFDNPMESEYVCSLRDIVEDSRDYIPSIPLSMLLSPGVTYRSAQETIEKETEEAKKNGVEINGKKMTLDELPGLPSLLYGRTKNSDFDWCDELSPFQEIRDVLIPEGKPRPDLKKRFRSQRSTAQNGRKKGCPFCYTVFLNVFFEDSLSFDIKIDRPKNVMPLIEDGYIDLEDYLDSIRFVTHDMRPDCIFKSGYNLFAYSAESYYSFIMMLHGPMKDEILPEAEKTGWSEPTMDLKKVFR